MPGRRPLFQTLINNVETFATIPAIIRNGGDWLAGMGTVVTANTTEFGRVTGLSWQDWSD